MQQFQMKVEFIQGKNNGIADTLSRAPVMEKAPEVIHEIPPAYR